MKRMLGARRSGGSKGEWPLEIKNVDFIKWWSWWNGVWYWLYEEYTSTICLQEINPSICSLENYWPLSSQPGFMKRNITLLSCGHMVMILCACILSNPHQAELNVSLVRYRDIYLMSSRMHWLFTGDCLKRLIDFLSFRSSLNRNAFMICWFVYLLIYLCFFMLDFLDEKKMCRLH